MRVLVDVDGVIRDMHSYMDKVYDREFPEETRSPITEWHFYKSYSIGKRVYDFAFKDFAKEIFGDAPAYPGAAKFVKELSNRGHRITICTSQNRYTSFVTMLWLNEHRIYYDDFYLTCYTKNETPEKMIKGDILIDDGLHNLENFDGTQICFAQGWNTEFKGKYRTNNYEEILNIIESIKEGS